MIPKRIIQTYKYTRLPLLFKICQELIQIKCNEYEYILYTNETCINFIKSNYPQYIEIYNNLSDKNKVFFFSLLELYKNGGIYIDLDCILYKKIDELINSDICIFPLVNKENIGKYFIMTNKNNKFILYLILQISMYYNINSNFITNTVLYKLFTKYKKNVVLICSEFKECFGNFAHNIKINSHGLYNEKYPNFFMSITYDEQKKRKTKYILIRDLNWIQNSNYHFL